MKVDHLIVGQGLAGSLLAWHLVNRNQRVMVVDRDEIVTSSKVAAGLVTPISGQQFSLPEGLPERLQFAQKTYWEIEEKIGLEFFHYRSIARLFRDLEDEMKWQKRMSSPRYVGFHSSLDVDSNLVHATNGGIKIDRGGWLDLPNFLRGIQRLLIETLSFAVGDLRAEEITILPEGGAFHGGM